MDGSGTLLASLLTGLGLAGAAGLNAYIPLLGVALLGRTHVLTLSPPLDVLMHPVAIGALGVLLALEVVVDKVPAADHVNDVVQTFIRPGAGALLFLGASGAAGQMPPLVLLLAGLVTAFGVHATKAAVRPAVNVSTLGLGTPVILAHRGPPVGDHHGRRGAGPGAGGADARRPALGGNQVHPAAPGRDLTDESGLPGPSKPA